MEDMLRMDEAGRRAEWVHSEVERQRELTVRDWALSVVCACCACRRAASRNAASGVINDTTEGVRQREETDWNAE